MKIVSMVAEIEKLQGSAVKSFSPRDQMAEQVRQAVAKEHTGNFSIFDGMKYDTKSDRYVATFANFQSCGGKTCSFKVTSAVAKFLLTNHDRKACHWYLTMADDGAICDVDILTYD